MKTGALTAIVAVMTFSVSTSGVLGGDWGKAPVGKAPIEECYDIGGQISAGYMTDYYFHGLHVAEDSVWVDVNYTFDNLALPVTVGVWYLNGIHPEDFDHLQLYASAALGTFFGFDTSIGYTHHFLPEDGDFENFGELGLQLRRSLGFVDLLLETNYLLGNAANDGSEGWYHEFALEKNIALTDGISLIITGGAGYVDGQIRSPAARVTTSGWNQYFLRAELPIQLNCRTTVTPYVGHFWYDAYLSRFDVTDTQDNFHGGVSVSVTF